MLHNIAKQLQDADFQEDAEEDEQDLRHVEDENNINSDYILLILT